MPSSISLPASLRATLTRLCLFAACIAAAVLPQAARSQAASAPAAARPLTDPTDVRAPVPPLRYRSAFDGYRPWAEQGRDDWKAVNEASARAGGWRAYLREAQQPDAAAPAAPAASQPSAPGATHRHH